MTFSKNIVHLQFSKPGKGDRSHIHLVLEIPESGKVVGGVGRNGGDDAGALVRLDVDHGQRVDRLVGGHRSLQTNAHDVLTLK